ncbi:MAG: DUF188 domain-containing protein, partial [Planctomycetes bacterium]|nr:DUF188 domain-containing protein [Planctomycetota bacterium]
MPATGRLFIDADACPYKDEVVEVARRFICTCIFVANMPLKKLEGRDGIETILCEQEFDGADKYILSHALGEDCVLTKDLLLAKLLVEKGIPVASFRGKPINSENIGQYLAMRGLKQEVREHDSGPKRQKNNIGKRKKEKSQFKESFHLFLGLHF